MDSFLQWLNSSYDSLLCFLVLEACWIQEHSVEEDNRTSLAIPCRFTFKCFALSFAMYVFICIYLSISVYMVSFALKLSRVYVKFSRKNIQFGVIDSWPPSLKPPKVCTVWRCFQSPSFLLWHFVLIFSLWWRRCHLRGSNFLLSLFLLVITGCFFFRWMVSYPSFRCSFLSCGFLLQPLEKPECWPRWARPHPPHW